MYGYAEIQTAVMVVLGAIAAFVLIVNGMKAWKELTKPSTDLKQLVDEHDEKLLNDHERLNDLKKSNEYQAKLLMQIANHLIDGNHKEQLIGARDEMQEYLLTR